MDRRRQAEWGSETKVACRSRGARLSLRSQAHDRPAAKLRWRAHTSLYIGKNVQRMIRRIAADLDRKPHDVLTEAVNDVLIKVRRSPSSTGDSRIHCTLAYRCTKALLLWPE